MVNPNPIKDSKRSMRRAKRGFKTLLTSSRIHKRAARRLGVAQVNKPNPQSEHHQHVGGNMNYNR